MAKERISLCLKSGWAEKDLGEMWNTAQKRQGWTSGGSIWNFSSPVQSLLVIDTWMLKSLERCSFCVLASAEFLLWRRSCSVSCCLLGARCCYLGGAVMWWQWNVSVLLPFGLCLQCLDFVAFHHIHSQTVALPYGPLLSSSFNEQFPSWPRVLRVVELFRTMSGAQTPLLPELPLLLPAAEPAPVYPRLEKPRPCVW